MTLKTPFTKRLEANPSAQMVVYLDCALGFTQKTGYMYLFKVIYLYKYIIIHWIQKSKYTRRCALGCALGFVVSYFFDFLVFFRFLVAF